MTENEQTQQSAWGEKTGLRPETVRVPIYPDQTQKQHWKAAAEKRGFASLSRYVIRRVEEARLFEEMDIGGPRHVHMTIEELQQENERLREELDQARKQSGARPEIDDADFLERFLTDQYRPLHEILQDIVESGVLNDLIRKRVESQLYYMAGNNRVEYERGFGWKLAEDGDPL